jgi:hypothetical protein
MNRLLRWILLGLLAGLLPRPAAFGQTPGEPPPLLAEAFDRLMENQGRWAYSETQVVAGLPGKSGGPTVLHVDPSLPYAEQYKLIEIGGKPPEPGDLERFRGLGERVAKRRERDRQASGEHPGDRLRIRLNFQVVTPDIAHATVVSQDAESVTYEVPLRTEGAGDFDKFQVTARVSRQRREFEHATFRQREPMRVALIATVAGAVLDFDFTSVDPKYPSVIARATQEATVGLLFMKRKISLEMTRGDFRHVTPYDERFGVKFGPIRVIDF